MPFTFSCSLKGQSNRLLWREMGNRLQCGAMTIEEHRACLLLGIVYKALCCSSTQEPKHHAVSPRNPCFRVETMHMEGQEGAEIVAAATVAVPAVLHAGEVRGIRQQVQAMSGRRWHL